ncbi:Putative alkylhalidase [Mariniradius saccharolyticus AK6]|uniref:Alkylhalidase n=1 Tax=Mariniradius saccharolyticus AK6 TaxID=1239962 RepID=M7YBD5_9BACT|nr:NAD(P)/FAD-dependent oxidoreductase [Mariniradius saccharolyticus]EMS34496.1 Putative alkylhalidase [Mariniradius saccharolyticus AK6]
MQETEILIVGGGLAGLVAAHQLAKAGREVLLVEKKAYPFHRVCGEYISNEVRGFLEQNGLFPESLAPSQIDRFVLTSTDGNRAEIPLEMGGFGISRYALDLFLMEKAKAAGAQILEKTQVESLAYDKFQDGFEAVLADGKRIRAKYILGAFGKRSKLDKALDRDFIHRRSPYIGVKYHIRTDFDPHTVALHNFDGGYCGVNRVENGTYNLCYLGSQKQLRQYGNIAAMEKAVLYQNPFLKEIFEHSEFLFDKPEVINEINFSPKSPVENHVLMLGDAAGLITPLCGNGMAIAIHTGKLATEAILQNKDRQAIEAQYRTEWKSHFQHRLWFGRQIQSLFGAKWVSEFSVGLIKKSPFLARQIIRMTHGKRI